MSVGGFSKQVSLRRRFIAGAGILVTLIALFLVNRSPGLYWERVTMVLLTPPALSGPNVLTAESPASVAAVTVMDATRRPLEVRASSPDATLFGLGTSRGTMVQVLNTGGQWAPVASQAYVDVQSVGATPELVERAADDSVTKVRRVLAERQDDLSVSPKYRASFQQVPPNPQATWVPPSRVRALAATALAGAGLTGLVMGLVDRRLQRP